MIRLVDSVENQVISYKKATPTQKAKDIVLQSVYNSSYWTEQGHIVDGMTDIEIAKVDDQVRKISLRIDKLLS